MGKSDYKHFALSHGIYVYCYHADNSRFVEEPFCAAVCQENKNITFCDFGSYHQNGIAKSYIKLLTLSSSTLLLHTK